MALQDEERRRLLEPFGLADAVGRPAAPPDGLGPQVVVSRDDATWAPYFVTVPVDDVEHLKRLAGVPSHVAATAASDGTYDASAFTTGTGTDGTELVDRARAALFGDWEGSLGAQDAAGEVRDFMLQAASQLPVFATTDLVVHDGEVYTLKDAPTFYFDSITVHGTGQIVAEGQVKIICDVITHVPA